MSKADPVSQQLCNQTRHTVSATVISKLCMYFAYKPTFAFQSPHQNCGWSTSPTERSNWNGNLAFTEAWSNTSGYVTHQQMLTKPLYHDFGMCTLPMQIRPLSVTWILAWNIQSTWCRWMIWASPISPPCPSSFAHQVRIYASVKLIIMSRHAYYNLVVVILLREILVHWGQM